MGKKLKKVMNINNENNFNERVSFLDKLVSFVNFNRKNHNLFKVSEVYL